MLLAAKILNDVAGVNNFEYDATFRFTEGDTVNLYFQLFDASVQGDGAPGRRYMPAVGATVSVVFGSIDDTKRLTKVATQPFTQDPSIWSVAITATDSIKGTSDLVLKLNEGGKITTGFIRQGISVSPALGSFI
jgi:hypothetical protein